MSKEIQSLEAKLIPLRKKLTDHPLYRTLEDLDDIRLFMESHVYAVWDFMSLLKALQRELTCTSLPWQPVANPRIARFINEIVWGEESDVNEQGVPRSHYEMYLDAMQEVGAEVEAIEQWLAGMDTLENMLDYIAKSDLQPAEKAFLHFTFATIQSGEVHQIAAAFTFGREDLIPDMFIEIINHSTKEGQGQFPKLKYYLERHIEVDGDEHGPLALEMIQEVCGTDQQKWKEAEAVAITALERRIALWDEIALRIGAEIRA
jgi:hypothetical protein